MSFDAKANRWAFLGRPAISGRASAFTALAVGPTTGVPHIALKDIQGR